MALVPGRWGDGVRFSASPLPLVGRLLGILAGEAAPHVRPYAALGAAPRWAARARRRRSRGHHGPRPPALTGDSVQAVGWSIFAAMALAGGSWAELAHDVHQHGAARRLHQAGGDLNVDDRAVFAPAPRDLTRRSAVIGATRDGRAIGRRQ